MLIILILFRPEKPIFAADAGVLDYVVAVLPPLCIKLRRKQAHFVRGLRFLLLKLEFCR
jgi:hypothetical protein